MKLQLTKTKTIDLSFGKGGGKRSSTVDSVGVELFSDDPRGVPAVRIAYRKSAWHLLATDFIKPPIGDLPGKWDEVSNRSTWELPSAFQAPHAAIAINSRLCLFSQSTADTVLQDMSRGIPTDEPASADAGKKRFALRRNNAPKEPEPDKPAAKTNVQVTQLPPVGIPTAINGMRFMVKPLAEEGQLLEAALPEFQVLWLARLLPEGHRPTASSIQPAEAALMASVLAQPALAESGGNAMVMFMLADGVIFGGYKAGRPVLWRRCPIRGGYLAMRDAVKRGLGLDDTMVDSVLEDTLIDPRGAIEPLLGPILNELDLSRAYLAGKQGMNIGRIMLVGLPAGGRHVCALAHDAFRMELFQPGVFDGLHKPAKGDIKEDCAFLPALGAALAASEVET